MRRREFIAGLAGAVAWPFGARAQQGERVRLVGFLTYGFGTAPIGRSVWHDHLEKLGWTEGRNLRLDFRFGDGDANRTRLLAADLVQLAPDAIVVAYGVALRALQQQTKTIPIVAATAGDLLENGSVRNLAYPEGNITGFTNAFASLGDKRVGLLNEVAPNITRVAHLYPAAFVGSYLKSVEIAGQSAGMEVVAIPISDAAGMKVAIEPFAAVRNSGLIPSPGTLDIVPPDELSQLALEYRLPVVSHGGLMNYMADFDEIARGATSYVDRLLCGANVSDLPVQYPTKFRLMINLKTAKALRLVVPSSILVRADEVIE